VFQVGHLRPGETLLVHGGSSGIGTMAIQLAKALGARVAVTAGSPDKLQACRALGTDILIWPLLDNGTVTPVIDRVLPIEAAPEAHRLMESSTHIGKILLQL